MNEATVMIVEDDPALRDALCDTLAVAGYRAAPVGDGRAALELLERESVGMVVSDVNMPELDGQQLLERIRGSQPALPVVLMTAYGTVQKAVEAMRAGAADYLLKPFDAAALVELVRRYLPEAARPDDGVVAQEARTRELLGLAERVANTDATVMITGESGTGKEVFARYVHEQSPRRDGPFVAINCAAIPENMLEAVLFGYEKGAFTGAYQARPGKFEQARGGTLLLDEISEMDLGLQAKLLRVLQEREVERLGGKHPIELDVRVLATSNRVMREEVAAGRFREDLFYRLNVFPLHLLPLRERPRDILPIAQRLLERHTPAGRSVPTLCPDAEQQLLAYQWPGNVRELENVLQRAIILMRGDCIEAAELHFEAEQMTVSAGIQAPPGTERQTAAAAAPVAAEEDLKEELRNREHRLIIEALEAAGSRKAAAEQLGISPRTLRYKLARMRDAGIPIPG
ncbi:sigma-54-dependent transcriptional regulator [Thiohalobacter thiocyanaticus]|uniref:Sigma-54-dependent Fis family transcriptional regulator n=1 Tax=Thiohalobacter thiocyanaticus TaxID=585455 RepID=A0A426QGP8_9GAMM|nr:sigma-54 dependent transcriptional regulator [Thiohalobacter thiocyanaticus]RRQ20924.1 sigma-54-dependent Fis family transcriptional regulator [Thiohalobacter thiocyanaticus]